LYAVAAASLPEFVPEIPLMHQLGESRQTLRTLLYITLSTRKMKFATDISYSEMTAEQLVLPNSQRVTVTTRHGKVVGGRVKNGCQVFLSMSVQVRNAHL
jgi:hypothetical protein